MAKYHINPETGVVSQCRAQTRCKFSATSEHYDYAEDALAAAEEQQEFVHRLLFSHEKKPVLLPEHAREEGRASSLSSLKNAEAKKEARLVQGLFNKTNWADEDSVSSYYGLLAQRKNKHEALMAAAKLQGQWNIAKVHASIAQELKKNA